MNTKLFLSMTALVGALGLSNLAHADHWRDRESTTIRHRERTLDVIGSARLNARRGEVTFTITPEMRRDGLQLITGKQGVRVLSVEFVYSDGRVERVRGRSLEAGDPLTIQDGRPPGLREVRVRYSANRSGRARLDLVQIHTGSGYTREVDRPEHPDYDPYNRVDRRDSRDRRYDRDDDYDTYYDD